MADYARKSPESAMHLLSNKRVPVNVVVLLKKGCNDVLKPSLKYLYLNVMCGQLCAWVKAPKFMGGIFPSINLIKSQHAFSERLIEPF